MPLTPATTEPPAIAAEEKLVDEICNDATAPARACDEAMDDLRRLENQEDPGWMAPEPPPPSYNAPDTCDIYDCTAPPGS